LLALVAMIVVGIPGQAWAALSASLEWARQIGGAESDDAYDIAADALGNTYVTGRTEGVLGADSAGASDAFVLAYDAFGIRKWSRQFGSGVQDGGRSLSLDSLGNVYVGGPTWGSVSGPNQGSSDAFLRKYDSTGAVAWTRQWGTSELEDVQGVATDELGNTYVAGLTAGSLGGTNAGAWDAFLSKYDDAGNALWSRQLGTPLYDYALDVAVDAIGNVYTTGYINSEGESHLPRNAFLSKHDAAGNLQWLQQISEAIGYAVTVDESGDIFIAGSTHPDLTAPNSDPVNGIVARYQASGSLAWLRQIPSSVIRSIAIDDRGSVVFTGAAGGDAVLGNVDGDGNLVWSLNWGTSALDTGFGVATDGAGGIYMAGSTSGSLAGPNAGRADAFVAKFVEIPEPTNLMAAAIAALVVVARQRGSRL
jgi:hypothetical protein